MSQSNIWIINQFAGTPDSGWGERHFYLSKPAVESGQRVVIISSGNNHMFNHKIKLSGLFTYQNYEGVEFLWIWIPPYNPQNITRFFSMLFFALVLLLLPYKKRLIGNPDQIVLSSMSIFPVPVVLLLKKILSIRSFVFEVRDLWPLTPILLKGYSKRNPLIFIISWLERLAYIKSDSIICLFDEAKSYINKISGSPGKFNWIPNGIDRSLLIGVNRADTLSEFRFTERKRIVCYAGTIGFANALDAFFDFISDPAFDDITNEYNFLIVGDGYLKADYERQVRDKDNVIFTGKVPKKEVQSILSQASICFISWHDSELYTYGVSANKYFDYMAASKPIVAAHHGIIDPVVKANCGFVVDNTKESIAAEFAQILNHSDEELQLLGIRGRQYVEQHHIYDHLSSRFFKIIRGE